MLLSHAVVLAEAPSYLAALADHADTFDASMEYERALLQLDWLHGGVVPSITVVPANDHTVLLDVARAAIGNLVAHGIDELELEICLVMLASGSSFLASGSCTVL